MLSLSQPFLQNAFCPAPSAVNKLHPFGLYTDRDKDLPNHLDTGKRTDKRQVSRGPVSFVDQQGAGTPIGQAAKIPRPQERATSKTELQSADDGCEPSCQKLSVQMNGGDSDSRMTGSSHHPRADQLNWLADVATGAARGPQSCSSSPTVVDSGEKVVGARPPPHLQGADPVAVRNAYESVLLGVSPMNQRTYSSQYHLEQLQPSSPTVGSGLSLYYSQAPRTAPYTGFYSGDHRLQYCAAIPDGLVGNRLSRPYFQSEALFHPAMPTTVQLQNNRNQLLHSPSYLHQATSISPVGSSASSPSSPHSRLSSSRAAAAAASNLLQSRSPEELLSQDKVPMPVSRNSPQFQHPDDKRTMYNSMEQKTASPVGDRMSASTSPYLVQEAQSKDLSMRQSSSPSHVHYKVPTGKEGSLKHRILRPPSISIVDPPSAIQDAAPLSAPPIRSTSHRQEEISAVTKAMRQDGYAAAYHRSFSTSSPFAVDGPHVSLHSPLFTPTCTLSSAATALGTVGSGVGWHVQNSQLKYPPAFMKGSIIQLANSQLKPVEQMTTEDFMECEALSPNLKIDSSTVVSIEKMPASGSAKLGFSVGDKKLQITVEAPLEHPFFVYKQGWSSCCPERSLLRYGLNCNKLKVGDTCIFLTVKSEPPPPAPSRSSVSTSPKPPTLVPTVSSAAESSASEGSTPGEHLGLQPQSSSMISKSSTASPSSVKVETATTAAASTSVQHRMAMSADVDTAAPPPKRKRRWSFPDRLSTCSPPSLKN